MGGVFASNRTAGSLLAFILLVVTFVVAVPQAAQSLSLTVDSSLCLSGDVNVYCTVEEAVAAATASAGPHTISIAAGSYPVETTLALGFDVTVDGSGRGSTTLVWADSASTPLASVTSSATVAMRNLTIDGNLSGGSLEVDGATLNLTDVEVLNATNSGPGGAIVFDVGASGTLIRANVNGNSATGFGGGIAVLGGSQVDVIASTIDGNTSGIGGGLYVDGPGSLATVSRSTISNNVGSSGAGAHATNSGKIDLQQSTISGNDGDGIFATDTGVLYLFHSTVAANLGVGVFSSVTSSVAFDQPGNVTLARTLVADNEIDGAPADCNNFISLAAFNLIGNNTLCTLGTEGTNDIVGTEAAPVNAELSPLMDNGGVTLTHALSATSRAVDAADPRVCFFLQDQRNVTRPQGGACDIGAFELEQGPLPMIQSLIEAAALDGTDVSIPAGFYNENITIHSGVQLTGSSPDAVTINGDGVGATITVASNTSIDGIRVTGGGDSGILVDGPWSVGISSVDVEGNRAVNGGGLLVDGGAVVDVSGSEFSLNETAEFSVTGTAQGGAIAVGPTGTVNIGSPTGTCATAPTALGFVPDTTFTSNVSSRGGAIYNAGTLNVFAALFVSNGARIGLGGALVHESDTGSTTVQCSVFNSNGTGGDGGAIGTVGSGDITVVNTLFDANNANSDAGAIAHLAGSMDVQGSAFSNNNAVDLGGAVLSTATFVGSDNSYLGNISFTGGAVRVETNSFISTGGFFDSNSAPFGAAISNASIGSVTLNAATISNNTSAFGAGINNNGLLTVEDSTFDSNFASEQGGGIFGNSNASMSVSGSLFLSNEANAASAAGGGIGGSGVSTIANTTFSQNAAPNGDGGGIGLEAGSASLSFATFVGNTATGAGGAFNGAVGSSIEIFASASQGNSSPSGPECSSYVSLGYNVVGGNPGCIFAPTDVIATTGFGPLQDNGGPTLTHAIDVSSPALDLVPSPPSYPAFDATSITDWQLNGVAALDGTSLLLASGVFEVGSAFTTAPVSTTQDFSATFEFTTTPDTEGGADGIVFSIFDSPTVLGDAGGYLGIADAIAGANGHVGVGNGVSVEFDMWVNGQAEGANDPDGNHIGINIDGSLVSSPLASITPSLSDGSTWTAWVDYEFATTTLEVRASNDGIRPLDPTLTTVVDLAALAGAEAYAGFSGSTGSAGISGEHRINSFSIGPCPTTDQRGVVRPSGAGCDAGAFEAAQIAGSLDSVTLRNNSEGFVDIGVVDIPITDIPIEKVTGAQSDGPTEASPLSTIPLSTIPLSTIDLNASPLSTIPLSTIPLSTIAIDGAPLSTIPLSTIPLSTIGGWAEVLEGTTLDGEPLQSVTLDEVPLFVLNDNDITMGDLTIQGSPLSTISLPTLALGDTTVTELDAALDGATVCDSIGTDYSCSGSSTLLDLEIQGAPLSTIPLSTIPLSTILLSNIPLSTIPLSTIPLSTIPLSTIPLSTISIEGVPLSTIPLSSIDIFGAPLSTIEVDGAPVSTIPLSTIDLLVSPLSTIPLSTIPLSTIPLSTINVDGTDFCEYYDAGAGVGATCDALLLDQTTDGLGELIVALAAAFPEMTIGTSPLSTIPLSTIDVSSAPLSTIDFSDPVVQSSPLSTIPLSTILIDGFPVCVYLADISLDSCGVATTFIELAGLYPVGGIAASPLSTIPLSTIDLDSAPLSTIDLEAVEFRGAPLSTIPLSTIDILNSPLSTIPLSTIPLSTIDLNASPLSTIPLSTIDVAHSPLSTIPLSTINLIGTPLSTIELFVVPLSTINLIVTCEVNTVGCETLGAAAANGSLVPGSTLGMLDGVYEGALGDLGAYGEATLGDLVGAFGDLTLGAIADLLGLPFSEMTFGQLMDGLNMSFLFGDLNLGEVGDYGDLTFGQLLIALMLRSDFPWESLPLDQLDPQEYSADNWLVYNLNMRTSGSGPDIDTVPSITIPEGFYFEPGSAVVNSSSLIPDGPVLVPPFDSSERPVLTGTPLADPSIVENPDGSQTLTFASIPVPLALSTTVSIVTVPSLDGGVKPAAGTATFGAEPVTDAVATAAGVFVNESELLDFGDDPGFPVPTDPDVLYIGHISYKGDVDYFEIDQPTDGDRVVVFMSNLDADGDLVLYKPLSAAADAPNNEGPALDGVPIEDDGVDFSGNITEEPNTLEDVPLLDGQPIGGVSTNRGTLDEEASAIATDNGAFIIQASMYNGATTQEPFVLRVKVNPEVPTPQCTPRGWTASGGTMPTITHDTFGPDTNSVFLLNWERIAQTESVQAANDVLAALEALADPAAGLGVNGVVLDVNALAAAEYADWDSNPCDADFANEIVDAIVDALDAAQVMSPNLTYVTIAGSDEVIPFARKVDETAIANESTFAGEFMDNAMYGSLVTRHFLSDDPYADLDPVQWLDRYLNVPDRSVGRLVEDSGDIVDAVDTFIAFGGFLDPQTAQTVGYDFLSDSSEDIDQAFIDNGFTPAPALIDQPDPDPDPLSTWGLIELRTALGLSNPVDSNDSFIPDILSLNMHFDFDEALTSRGDATHDQTGELFTVSDLWDVGSMQEVDLNGTIIFTVGCHSGTSVADVAVGAGEASQDWAQTMGNAGASYVAQNAYGLGDDTANALTERLMTTFAENMDGSMTIGQALTFAKQSYFADLGMYGEYDYKAMQAATFYGLPMYNIGTPPSGALAAAGDISPTPDPVSAINSAAISMDATDYVILETVTDNGTYFNVDGESQFVHYRPLQPIVRMDVTPDNGQVAQGAFLTSLTTRDLNVADIAYAMPVVDQGALSPAVKSDEMVFPTTFTNIARYNAPPTGAGLYDERQQLNVMVGQFTSGLDGDTDGVQRLFESFESLVYYAAPGSPDQTRPFITNVQGGLGGDIVGGTGQAVFGVDASDASGVARVAVLYRQSTDLTGVGQWTLVDLVPTGGRWTGGGAVDASGLVDGQVDYMVQAVDSAGNVANSTFKGLFYVAEELPPPTLDDEIQVEVTGDLVLNGWFEGPVTVDPIDDDQEYEYSVDGDAFVPLPAGDEIVVSGEGPHLVTIRTTDGSFSVTFVVLIDTSDPTVEIYEPLPGEVVEEGADVEGEFLCFDGGSGISTCIGAGGVDTATLGPQTLTVTATDRAGHTEEATSSYTVVRSLIIAGPEAPIAVGGTALFTSVFTDSLSDETVTWDFGDGSLCSGGPDCSQTPPSEGEVDLAASHTYTTPGVYEVVLTIDYGADVQVASFQYVVVFDPTGGFVTGGGWIDSPTGAYTPNDLADPDLVGKAHFGFVAKYKKGATIPEGSTSFRFDTADMSFASEDYQWLVISGDVARFKGTGYVDGDDQLYQFQVTGFDADVNPDDGHDADGFRIKIWYETTYYDDFGTEVTVEHVLYDSGLGEDGNAGVGATTELGGGSIVAHKPKPPGKK